MRLGDAIEGERPNSGDDGICFGQFEERYDSLRGLIVRDEDSSQVVVGAGEERSEELD
jgi:hypothetical protein